MEEQMAAVLLASASASIHAHSLLKTLHAEPAAAGM